jgi:DNA-binding response OmpR family regulator
MRTQPLARILVVDDDEWIISGAKVVLEAEGFEVCSAKDGEKGLESAYENSPDLIVTDVLMGGMDGWTFVRTIRSDARFALVPVIFLTSKKSAEDRITGFQLGADDYLAKPINFHELPRRVKKALAQRRQLETEFRLVNRPTLGAKTLQGSLDRIGMASLLSVLAASQRSGIIRINGPMVKGEMLLYLVQGHPYRIEVQGIGRMTSEEASQELFCCSEGRFEFVPMRLRVSDELNISMNQLLLRGARGSSLLPSSRPPRCG